jgi:hypothetical protein
MLRPCVALLSLLSVAACTSGEPSSPELCGTVAPTDAETMTDASAEGGAPMPVEDTGVDPNVAYCAPCGSLSSGAVDQAMVMRFASEIDPVVIAGTPGGAPIMMPGALGLGVSPGVYARLAAAANNALASREIAPVLTARLETLAREATLVPPLGPSVGGSENFIAIDGLGESCAGAVALRTVTSDPAVPQLVAGAAVDVVPVLDGTTVHVQQFLIDRQNDPRWLAGAARLLGSCGALAGDSTAVSAGVEMVDRVLQLQDSTGAFTDETGQFDTNRQAYVLIALMDTLKSVQRSGCATRMRRIELGAGWLAGRVTALGQVDSSNSRTTCADGGESFDLRQSFLALAGSSALFEAAPDGPLAMKVLSMSTFALMNPGRPSCFP